MKINAKIAFHIRIYIFRRESHFLPREISLSELKKTKDLCKSPHPLLATSYPVTRWGQGECWSRLPGVVVQPPSMEIYKAQLDTVLL